jgi:predicted GH43/DUF377 family glycosyl hydrolase
MMSRTTRVDVGAFRKIYDPSLVTERWYINDHTLIRDGAGLWHLFGITHAEPLNPLDERFFAHATAPSLEGPWTRQAPVLPYDASQGETHVWAPYVLRHGGRYWMFYCGGGATHQQYRIQLATSPDLWTWTRAQTNPLIVDGFDARDPMVLRLKDKWVLYYTATSVPEGGHHVVKAAFSDDLLNWSGAIEVYRDPASGTFGGPTESPFVVARDGRYFLFVCTNRDYSETAVYESDDPLHWEHADCVGFYPAHASEIVTDDGRWYATHCGWGQGGVYLASLTWEPK